MVSTFAAAHSGGHVPEFGSSSSGLTISRWSGRAARQQDTVRDADPHGRTIVAVGDSEQCVQYVVVWCSVAPDWGMPRTFMLVSGRA